MNLPTTIVRFVEEVIKVPRVIALVVGGSWAKGTNTPDSDIDLALYYAPKNPPNLDTLREVANQFDDAPRQDILTSFGEWGPWINGGGWLTIKSQRVDLLYSNLEHIEHHIQETLEGRSILNHQPGHPHGFHTHMFAGQVHLCKVLFDPHNKIGNLKELLKPYPAKLKASLIKDFLWQAEFALHVAEKGASRGDIFYVNGFLFDCAASLVQVLFALNETFWLNEKGAMDITESFKYKPMHFRKIIETVLANIGTNPKELIQSLQHFKDLVQETRALSQR